MHQTTLMQLSQLDKAVFTSEMLSPASDIILLSANACCKLLASIPLTPPLKLLVIATSIEGILTHSSDAQPTVVIFDGVYVLETRGTRVILGLRIRYLVQQ